MAPDSYEVSGEGPQDFARFLATSRADGKAIAELGEQLNQLLRLRTFSEYLADGWALIGAPAEVRDGLQQYFDATGYQRVLLLMALPGIETPLALRSMRLFAEAVAPAMTGAVSAQRS